MNDVAKKFFGIDSNPSATSGDQPLVAPARPLPARPTIPIVQDPAPATEAGLSAVAQSVAKLSSVEMRNVRHSRALNAILMTLLENDRQHFEPQDIGDFYVIINALDSVAGLTATPRHPAFTDRSSTDKTTSDAERAQHGQSDTAEG